MKTVQLGIRIPANLNDRLTTFMEQTGISKTEAVVSALASYLECTEEISLTKRMANIEARMVQLESLVRSK